MEILCTAMPMRLILSGEKCLGSAEVSRCCDTNVIGSKTCERVVKAFPYIAH